MKKNGFTIVELLISMFIGMLILGGVIVTYISMKSTTRDTMGIGEMQEIGRLSLAILRRDIEQVGFWGTFYESEFSVLNTTAEPNPGNDCFGGENNGSFPNADPTNFRPIYSEISDGGQMLSCVNDSMENTDVIQLKFLEGRMIEDPDPDIDDNRYYFIAEQERAQFVSGETGAILPNVNATRWPYSHHVYYIKEDEITINNKKLNVPTLMRMRLRVTGGLISEPVMEGVEDLRFVFGIDTDADSRVDTYRSTADMDATMWESNDAILTVQVYILVRSLEPDPDISLKSQTYTLGLDEDKREHVFTDKYRRTVFSTTIRLNNMGSNAWSIPVNNGV